jgi:hypothetical protein
MINRVKNRLCKCGCGTMVANDYARGHCHRMGFSHSEESKQKISKSQTGKKFGTHTEEARKKISESKKGSKWSEETRIKMMALKQSKKIVKEQKLCECGCGALASPGKRFLPSHHHRCRTEETRKKFSEVRKGKPASDELRRKRSENGKVRAGVNHHMYGKHHSEESKQKMSESQTGKVCSEESKMNMSKAQKLAWQNPENREKWILSKNDPELLEHMREVMTSHWRDPKFVAKMKIARNVKPNKSELMLLDLLDRLYPNEWKYVGDFSFMVNGKNPDFVNINGKKLLIELFGDYWHQGDDPEDRKDVFREFGYETLVIWESDLKQRPILTERRIQMFVETN